MPLYTLSSTTLGSTLLEVMEEGKVTVDQITHELPKPFVVIATQNPVGSAGTSMLPQSQLDRFMICMHIGYPDMKYELEIVKGKITTDPLDLVEPVMNGAQLLRLHKIRLCEKGIFYKKCKVVSRNAWIQSCRKISGKRWT